MFTIKYTADYTDFFSERYFVGFTVILQRRSPKNKVIGNMISALIFYRLAI